MKLLWAGPGFLHPTTRGGQIRTLGMLRQMHSRHEIHYVALAHPEDEEGPRRALEYSSRAFPVEHRTTPKTSPKFAWELVGGLLSPLPVSISRWRSDAMRRKIAQLMQEESYDAVVCDFLVAAINFERLDHAVLFQHNVESMIWQRSAATATNPARRIYFGLQASRMLAFERDVCRRAARVIAVSEDDRASMKRMFGVEAAAVPTGVDLEYFRPPAENVQKSHGLVFVGSMDWMPNIDGVLWFIREVLPLIRALRNDLPVTIVGRTPPQNVLALAESDPHLHVTGSVPDVRPYFWGAAASVVPLRIGGGTRLKIYEAMAAGAPVVSTTIGAEGLEVADGATIALADTPQDFARRCVELVEDTGLSQRMSQAARKLVEERFSWDQVTRQFEALLK